MMNYKNIILQDPWFLLLIFTIPLILYVRQRWQKRGAIRYPTLDHLQGITPSIKSRLRPLLIVLRTLALILFIIALARPQLGVRKDRVTQDGIDIVLAVDVSGSMYAEDFTIDNQRVNRLEMVKKVLEEFIPRRFNDRLGMVIFSGRAYTVAPLTWDQDWLIQRMEQLEIGLDENGTAIGSAIMASLNRLKDSQAKSKILILLTDGRNNVGAIDPKVAAETAKALGVKIYTIGAGSREPVPYPMKAADGSRIYQMLDIPIDDQFLTEIAHKTMGRYYRATNSKELFQIYDEIDRLEKTEIEMDSFYNYKEIYPYFLLLALLCLMLELILENTILRRLP